MVSVEVIENIINYLGFQKNMKCLMDFLSELIRKLTDEPKRVIAP